MSIGEVGTGLGSIELHRRVPQVSVPSMIGLVAFTQPGTFINSYREGIGLTSAVVQWGSPSRSGFFSYPMDGRQLRNRAYPLTDGGLREWRHE